MLSALIHSECGYPAVLLTEQLAHQGFVPFGPLVKLSHITMCSDYILTTLLSKK